MVTVVWSAYQVMLHSVVMSVSPVNVALSMSNISGETTLPLKLGIECIWR